MTVKEQAKEHLISFHGSNMNCQMCEWAKRILELELQKPEKTWVEMQKDKRDGIRGCLGY